MVLACADMGVPVGDLAYLTSLRTAPQTAFQTEIALSDLFMALAEEEFNSGGIETYAVHRVVGDPGAYQIYGQYTTAAERNHLSGPRARKAYKKVLDRMILPLERVRLDPVKKGLWGAAKPVGADLTGDEAWRFTVRVAPEDVAKGDDVFERIMEAMAYDEFPGGQVKSYTAFRVYGDTGRYIMYEHFTARGSAQHATGERLPTVGREQMELLVTPFERLQLEPFLAFGIQYDSAKDSRRAAG